MSTVMWRTRYAVASVLSVAALLTATSCARSAGVDATAPSPAAHTLAPPQPKPAALAGGACLLMDFGVVNKALGSSFNVAAAADKSGTYTCVLETSKADVPNLTIAITSTDLTVAEFKSLAVPSGSASVTGLGKIGYSEQIAAAKTTGAGVEVGWLSGNGRLIVMRYTLAADGSVGSGLTDQVVALARTVDLTTV